MRTPKAEKEDPAVVAAREAEQRRAENQRTFETQALLIGATQRRLRRTGKISGGSVPLIGAPAGGAAPGASSSGFSAASAGREGGGFSSRFDGLFDTAIY